MTDCPHRYVHTERYQTQDGRMVRSVLRATCVQCGETVALWPPAETNTGGP